MTENEAVKWIKAISATQSGSMHKNSLSERKEALHMAIVAIEGIQQYRVIEKRLDDMFGGQLPLEHYVDRLEEALKEPGKPHPVNARILTYEDADM